MPLDPHYLPVVVRLLTEHPELYDNLQCLLDLLEIDGDNTPYVEAMLAAGIVPVVLRLLRGILAQGLKGNEYDCKLACTVLADIAHHGITTRTGNGKGNAHRAVFDKEGALETLLEVLGQCVATPGYESHSSLKYVAKEAALTVCALLKGFFVVMNE
jgi:hypothetical protein